MRITNLILTPLLLFCAACNPIEILTNQNGDPASTEGETSPKSSSPGPVVAPQSFIDTFEGNASLAWTPHKRTAVTGGELAVALGQDAMTLWIPPRIVNGHFAATVTFNEGDRSKAFGLVFRQFDSTNYDYFYVNGSGNYMLGRMVQGRHRQLTGWKQDATTIQTGPNQLEVDFSGFLIRCFVNGTQLVHAYVDAYEDKVVPGQVALFADAAVAVSFDNVRLTDHQKAPHVTGVISQHGEVMPGSPVRMFLMVDPARMEGRFIDAQLADSAGRYAFHMPLEGIYLVEAGVPAGQYQQGKGTYGARFVDSPIENNGPLDRPIELVSHKGGTP